jgi:hypothetical protein
MWSQRSTGRWATYSTTARARRVTTRTAGAWAAPYDSDGKKRFTQSGHTNGARTTLYRLAEVQKAAQNNEPILLVESEKDVLAGNFHKAGPTPLYGAQIIAIAHRRRKRREVGAAGGRRPWRQSISTTRCTDHATSGRAAARPSALSDESSSTAVLLTVVQSPQAGYLTHCDATATPLGCLAHGQALLIGHRLQRRAGAPLGVANRNVAFTKCGHHLYRQPLEPAFAFGTFLTPYCLSVQRRPSHSLPHRLLTHHRIPPRHSSFTRP